MTKTEQKCFVTVYGKERDEVKAVRQIIEYLKNWRKHSKNMSFLLHYARPYLKKIFLLLLLDIAASVLGVGLAVISKDIIDTAVTGKGIVMEAILLYLIIILVSLFLSSATNLLASIVNERFSFSIRKQIYDKIVRSYWMDIRNYHTGDLLTRVTTDANNIADGIIHVIPTIIRLVVEVIITFFTLLYFQPIIAVFSLSMAPVIALISFLLGRRLKALQLKVQETESKYRSFIQESLSNLLVVKSFTNEEYVSGRLSQLRDERFYWVFKRSRISVASSTIMSLAFQLGYIGALGFGAVLLSSNAITFGTLSIFLTLVNRIQGPVLALAIYVPKIVSILASSERIVEINHISLEEKQESDIPLEHIGLNLRDVSFGYEEDRVLENLFLTIQPGEFIAIVGRSGIGKTTLIRLIMSFMSNMEGTIEFQNGSGEKVRANAGTRKYIAYVPQGNTLFSGTIRENIRMGRLDATEEEMMEALKMAAAYEFVCELPKGIDTLIGEHGYGLSEGQAQRIAIARALIRKAPLLILDEATSSLDERTELAVLRGIQGLQPRPTCLIISHRRSVLEYCDREIRISDKKAVEQLKRLEEQEKLWNWERQT